MLNSRPVGLLLGVYKKDGGAQELDSHLPDSWTAISADDMIIGDGTAGKNSVNYSPDNGQRRLNYIQAKIDHWHSTWVQACQDRLFTIDCPWVDKSRNLQQGDVACLIQTNWELLGR